MNSDHTVQSEPAPAPLPLNSFARNGRAVSRLGFGAMGLTGTTWPFGAIEERSAINSVLYALERGINFIDTARGYGRSEEFIGKALRAWDGETPFVATKVNSVGPLEQWQVPVPVSEAFPKGHIRKMALESLEQLGLDRLDLLQLHLYWPTWGSQGYWLDELLELRDEGLVSHIGVSLPDHRCDVGLELVNSGVVDSIQTIFNIFDPQPLDCLIPACKKQGVAVIARCVLDEGGLTGSLEADTCFAKGDYRDGYFDVVSRNNYLERIERLRAFIPEHAGSLAALALKFVLHDPGVTVAISSMHVSAHCDANIVAVGEPPLSPETFTLLRHYHRWVRNFYTAKIFWETQ
jgi:aryl-alcohol dehydrogenase-like predicted oxidoreductase